MKPGTCLIFDLDGTLVDSVPDLTLCINRLLASRNLAPLAAHQIVGMVGDGAAALVKRAFAVYRLHPDATAMDEFLADYQAHATARSKLYPGVADTLRALAAQGYAMGVCTNKPEALARKVLEELGIGQFFQAVGGGDSFPVRKPDPKHLVLTIKAAGGNAADAVMTGDHANDINAALGAGVPAIFAAWGYGTLEMAVGARFTARDFEQIPDLIKQIIKK